MQTQSRPRDVRFPATVFGSLRAALAREGIDASTCVASLRATGYGLGEAFSVDLAANIGGEGEEVDLRSVAPDVYWNAVALTFRDLGWGTLRFEEPHPAVGALVSDDWIEADAQDGLDHPGCHLTTGFLADLLGRLAGADVAVLEVECRARGDDQCTFLFGAPETLHSIYAQMQGGSTAGDAIGALAG